VDRLKKTLYEFLMWLDGNFQEVRYSFSKTHVRISIYQESFTKDALEKIFNKAKECLLEIDDYRFVAETRLHEFIGRKETVVRFSFKVKAY